MWYNMIYREVKGSTQWCYDNYINPRSMKTATEIRKQLVGYCQKLEIPEIVGIEWEVDGIIWIELWGRTRSSEKMSHCGNVHSNCQKSDRSGKEQSSRIQNDGREQNCCNSPRFGSFPKETLPWSYCLYNILLMNLCTIWYLLFQEGRSFLNLHELVYTTKDYYRGVTAIEANWISELVPEWFSQKTG